MFKLSSIYTIHSGYGEVGGALLTLNQHWQLPEFQSRMVVPSCEDDARFDFVVEAIPRRLRALYYRFPNLPERMTEKRFLKDLNEFDAALLWPGTSLDTFDRVREKGKPLFLERINTFMGASRQILDDAYDRLGLSAQHTITTDRILKEKEKLKRADYVFCPSPIAKQTFLEAGVPHEKLIVTSYGWSPQQLNPPPPSYTQKKEGLTFLFLGSICVRKGTHLLLRAWAKSGIKGRLIMFGTIEDAIAQTCADLLDRPDVEHRPFSTTYQTAYSEADIFVFPSLEEGSPLVMYEASAHGLPIVTSPMGGGGIVRDRIEGIEIDPYHEEALIEAMRTLANSPDLREQYGQAARARSVEFTWENVAKRRAQAIMAKVRGSVPQLSKTR
jgi:glycosyltransferase involved in cell wall biosynthesis